jgi:hypothetical protein
MAPDRIAQAKDHPQHDAIPIAEIFAGTADLQVDKALYFSGGYFWRLEHISDHERFAADDVGHGRDGWKSGLFNHAVELAEKQTEMFLIWARSDGTKADGGMRNDVRMELYGS